MTDTTIVLLSMRQVQAALNIRSRSTIYDMVARKALPPPCVINRRGLALARERYPRLDR